MIHSTIRRELCDYCREKYNKYSEMGCPFCNKGYVMVTTHDIYDYAEHMIDIDYSRAHWSDVRPCTDNELPEHAGEDWPYGPDAPDIPF